MDKINLNNNSKNDLSKIAIIGAGFVGASTAFSLLIRGIASEIVLIDVNKEKAEGEASDLMHGVPFVKPCDIYAGDYKDCVGAGIVIVTAGANQSPGETRVDLAKRNSEIFKKIIPEIVKYNPDCILLIVTNPVDSLTYLSYKISGLPRNRVIGSGTVLDTARYRSIIAKETCIDSRNVHGYILGEHGDSEVAAFSITNIAGIPIEQYSQRCDKEGLNLDRIKLLDDVRNSAYEIISKKGATYYAIALGVTRIVEAIVRDEKSVLTVSSFIEGEYGLRDVCFSVPTVVGRNGIEKVLDIVVSEDEYKDLKKSAEAIKKVIDNIVDNSNI